MATSIHDDLQLVLRGCEEARNTQSFSGRHEELWKIFDALSRDCVESPFVKSRPLYAWCRAQARAGSCGM